MCYYKLSNLPKVKLTYYTKHNVANNRSLQFTNIDKAHSNVSQKSATQYENKVSNLVKSVMKIQKYKWTKNMPKFNDYVKQLKEKYSICDAARTLKMHYSQLHSLLSCKKIHMANLCHNVQRKM